jgi:hypothetical protein
MELKPSYSQKYLEREYRVLYEEKLVTVLMKSANGSRKYLEVVMDYPDIVWDSINWSHRLSQQYPMTLLLMASTNTCTAALELGYKLDYYLAVTGNISQAIADSDRDAQEFLEKVLASTATEVIQEENTSSEVPPTSISTDELLDIMGILEEKKVFSITNLQKVGTAKKDSTETRNSKIMKVTGGYLPLDETRTRWVLQKEELVLS